MRKRTLAKERLALGLVPPARAAIAAGCGAGSPSGTTGPAYGAAPARRSTASAAVIARAHAVATWARHLGALALLGAHLAITEGTT